MLKRNSKIYYMQNVDQVNSDLEEKIKTHKVND